MCSANVMQRGSPRQHARPPPLRPCGAAPAAAVRATTASGSCWRAGTTPGRGPVKALHSRRVPGAERRFANGRQPATSQTITSELILYRTADERTRIERPPTKPTQHCCESQVIQKVSPKSPKSCGKVVSLEVASTGTAPCRTSRTSVALANAGAQNPAPIVG